MYHCRLAESQCRSLAIAPVPRYDSYRPTARFGNLVLISQNVELQKPGKLVLEKDTRESAERWFIVTVHGIAVDEQMIV